MDGVGKSVLGAANELLVAADLTLRGYAVYRAVSPSAPFDLVAVKGEAILRVEVRASRERSDGTLYPYTKVSDVCDIYAFVAGQRIEYGDAADVKARIGRGHLSSERFVPIHP